MANLSIPDDLFKEFRIACIARDTSASKEITRLMEEQLQQWRQEQDTSERQP